jgi:3-carboxy-cis,cis-muconate cycloisomerase
MSDLLDPLFGDPEVASAFTAEAQLRAMLEFEVALARALAEVGVIPSAAIEPIARASQASPDPAAIAAGAARAGNLAIPLVEDLTARVAALDPDAARYVHWGATSQDVLDTALVLQLRTAVPIIAGRLAAAAEAAAGLARRHADTVLPGRTWLQHATPVTFGLKAAGWFDASSRVRSRLESASSAALVLQFGGAAGTLAALGERGLEVETALGRCLGLPVPRFPWHAHRDRLADLGCALGVVAGELGKIGRDLALMAQTEVAEIAEAAPGRSSTMPQKRNPLGAVVALAASYRAPGLVATLLAAMPEEHERGIGGWQAEWAALPELVQVAAGAARAMAETLASLVVFPERMRVNLESSGGLIYAEAVATALAAAVGKGRAHALVAAACRQVGPGRHLREVVQQDPEIASRLSAEQLDALFRPESYLGSTKALIDRALSR